MSMTETPSPAPAKKPAKKRKARKTPRRASFHKAAAPKVEAYPGLTNNTCSTACNADGCAISGRSYCAHPSKGGLQAVDLGNAEALSRLKAARKMLSSADVDKKFD